ncbi:hypothetical protein AB1Y20_006513 [Prymnesium parvum]|uniref:Tubulin delta chain n=1 Tax=Prymnesium parvum TaxID=97485 RepID=A0AB34IXP8_PRYPA
MSTVFLHVGQAGNEVAAAFWKLAAAEKPPQRYLFDARGRCRAVLVDTEAKVVRGAVASVGADRLHPRCALVEQGGRGNNWAMGYHGAGDAPGRGVADAAMEAVRWQVEGCDWFAGLTLCHSIGGGTGAGLGSLLLQEARDAYPSQYLTAASLSPFAAGELPLGFYNATLALSFLQEYSDAVLLFDNAAMLNQLAAVAATASHASSHSSRAPPRLCMRTLDEYVARALAGLVFPTDGAAGRRPFDAGELVSSVCPMPSAKFLRLHSSPPPPPPSTSSTASSSAPSSSSSASRAPSWETIVADCASRLPRYDLYHKPVVSLSSVAIARGTGAEPPDARVRERVAALMGPSPVTSSSVDWKLSSSVQTALPSVGMHRSLTVASNRCCVAAQMEQLVLRAQLQLSERAYLHHYERYGVSSDYISSRLELVRQVGDDYAAMSSAVARKPSRLAS